MRLLLVPLRWLARVALRLALAAAVLAASNVWLGPAGLHMGLNAVTVLSVAALGLPGLAALVALRALLGAP
ncbi:MAG: pro-sigmaK processing inhibitor BofA family protein [Clostridia bacterium]|nr:pro-sigmaK processing inhibitor BofA family protein [Clostridia bacterium]